MKVNCYSVYTHLAPHELQGKTAIMIDVLRASATMITAIANGCDRIVPVEEANEAAFIKRISEGKLLLCGEIEAQKIGGFDLGNSPLEYTEDAVSEQIIVYSTTNGSCAVKAMSDANELLVGSFINATAVAKNAVDLGNDTTIVCAGTKGKFSTDDFLAMGCILDRMMEMNPEIETDDLGRLAIKEYRREKDDILKALEGSVHNEYLKQLKLYDDLEYCTREDVFDIVPHYRESVIVK